MSVDVKNYDLSTPRGRDRLVADIATQAAGRAPNLPGNTRQATIVDVRGQDTTPELLDQIRTRIVDASGGQISADNIVFTTDESDED